MKKIIFFLMLVCPFVSTNAQLSSYELIASYTIDELMALATANNIPTTIVSFDYEVEVYKVIYDTPGVDGNMTIASGAFAIPKDNTCALPLASYQHGTTTKKTDVPSHLSDEGNIGLLFATAGYFVALPDYLGLGDSPGLHPYVHSDSEASATIDMLRSCRQIVAQENWLMNEQLFLFGYSQGGHATVAAQRSLELDFSDEFTITASHPMAGPYDVSGVQADVITADEPYPTPSYLPYIIFAYQSVYGNLYTDISEVFIAPYDTMLPPLFDGTFGTGYINNIMPSIPSAVLQPDIITAFENDPMHPLRIALADNDLYDWAPQAPTRLVYCMGDDQVGYMNSLVAYDAFIANGAPNVEQLDLGDLNHNGCANPSFLSCLVYFNNFKEEGFVVTSELIQLSTMGANDGSISLAVAGVNGLLSFDWSNGETTASINNLTAGTYTVTVNDDTNCAKVLSFEIVEEPLSIGAEPIVGNELQIYPNPASDFVKIKLSQPMMPSAQVMVYDFSGRLLHQSTFDGLEYELDVSEFSSGMLVLRIGGNQRVLIMKN